MPAIRKIRKVLKNKPTIEGAGVHLKDEFSGDDLVCHCFGYTAKDIEKDYLDNGRSMIFEKISFEKKTGGCDCARKNPKGR